MGMTEGRVDMDGEIDKGESEKRWRRTWEFDSLDGARDPL